MSDLKQTLADVVSTAVVIGGIITAVVAAEASAPVVAGIGALAAAGTGITRAIKAPARHERDDHRVTPTDCVR